MDIQGNEKKTYSYNAYGKENPFILNPMGNQTAILQWKAETEQIYNPFRYVGEYYDSETGLTYLRNRYYDNSIGRFITEDPIRDGTNWYVYCNSNPVMFVDPNGLDAIIITADHAARGYGHTSALYQDSNGDWFYTYWGDKAAAVIRIPDTYTQWLRDGNITTNSMASLSDFNNTLNNFLWENGFENITSNYTDATYVVGDFTDSLGAAYADVNTANNNFFSNGNLTTLDDGSLVFQGKNGAYSLFSNNCFDRTFKSFVLGTLSDGQSANIYTMTFGITDAGISIPNDYRTNFETAFSNNSFTLDGARTEAIQAILLYGDGQKFLYPSQINYLFSAIK